MFQLFHYHLTITTDNGRYELTYPNLLADKLLAVFDKNRLPINIVRQLILALLQMH